MASELASFQYRGQRRLGSRQRRGRLRLTGGARLLSVLRLSVVLFHGPPERQVISITVPYRRCENWRLLLQMPSGKSEGERHCPGASSRASLAPEDSIPQVNACWLRQPHQVTHLELHRMRSLTPEHPDVFWPFGGRTCFGLPVGYRPRKKRRRQARPPTSVRSSRIRPSPASCVHPSIRLVRSPTSCARRARC